MTISKRFNSTITPKRMVVKVGTSSLTHASGLIDLEKAENIVRQLVILKNKGIDVVLVSSGAIGAGVGRLNVDKKVASLAQKQALAAVGQNILMHIYLKFAAEYGVNVGQILLTREDIFDKQRGQYSKQAIEALLNYHVLPIINENDAVAVEEIKFGDNDRLSAMVAKLIGADWLVILSDVDGLYDKNPNDDKEAKLIYHVPKLTSEHIKSAKGSGGELGTGGMVTKLMAVTIAAESGVQTVIANSDTPNILSRIFNGEQLGTWFESGGHDGYRDM